MNSLNKNNNKRVIIVLFILSVALIYSVSKAGETDNIKLYDSYFSSAPGIVAGAEMHSDINGQKIMQIRLKNISNKNIRRILIYFYFENPDVEMKNSSVIIYDNTIEAGDSAKYVYAFTEDEADKTEVYIYNIWYDDDSEWGNENASELQIINEGYKLNVVNVRDK